MRKFKRVGLILLTSFLLISTMLYFIQEKLIFLPTELPQDYQYSFSESVEELFLDSFDGARLNGLHFRRENPNGVILYFHGNAGDLSRWGEIATFFVQKNYDVVIMDYRTYGKSTGKLSEEALFADAQLFYDYVLEHYAENQIRVYGRSLGAAIATQVASNNKPSKLILETPFYNLHDVARERFAFLPLKLLLNYKFESNVFIEKVTCPITIFHGTEDNVVSYESGKKLYHTATAEKELITVVGGGHNDLINFEAYTTAIDAVLE